MGVGQLSESDAVDALRLPFYSSSHPTGSHGWRNQFDLGNPDLGLFAKESTSGGKGWPKRWVSVGYVTILWWRPCPRFSIRRHFYSTPRQGYREAKLPSGYSVRCCSRFSIRGEPDAD